MLRFVDDIVVLITSEKNLQAAQNEINNTLEQYNLKINVVKTKIQVYYKKIILTINITLENINIVKLTILST